MKKMKENYIWKIAGIQEPVVFIFNKSIKQFELRKEHMDSFPYKIFKIFQEKLNFRYEFVHPMPKHGLIKYGNGTYGGMMGQIINQEADFGYLEYPIKNDLYNLLDISTFINIDSTRFLAVQRKWSLNWDTIVRPFSIEIWIAILISLFLVGLVTSLLMRYEQKISKTTKFWSFKKSIWYLFGTCAGQGSDLDSINRFPSRFVLGVWLLSALILSFAYSGVLTSFMTATVYEQVPKTFHQLAIAVEEQKFSCGTIPVFKRMYFKDVISGDAKILKDHIEEYDRKLSEMFKRFQNDRFAVIFPKEYLDYLKKLAQRTIISEDSFSIYLSSYYMRKGFPYKNKINEIIAHLHESGIIDHIRKAANTKDKRIPSYINDDEIHPLNLYELSSCFLLLITGYMLSTICLIGEILAARIGRKSDALCK